MFMPRPESSKCILLESVDLACTKIIIYYFHKTWCKINDVIGTGSRNGDQLTVS